MRCPGPAFRLCTSTTVVAAASPNCAPSSQLGNRPIALDRRQRHLRLECCVVLLPCPLHILLPRHRRFLGAGLHLSLLSHFQGLKWTPFVRQPEPRLKV